jgi:hypothetical protein
MDTPRTSNTGTVRASRLRAVLLTSLAATMAAVVGCGGEIGDPISSTTGKIVDQQDGIESFARDVFVIVGSSLKNPDDTTAADAPLFNVAGVSLNLTWGQFSGASATSTAECLADGTTDVNITLTGLVPGGVYSMFYGTFGPDSSNPACPGVERTLPLESVCPAVHPGGSNGGGSGGSHPGHDPGTDPQPDHGDDDHHGHQRHYTHHHHIVHHGRCGHDPNHHGDDDHDGDDHDHNGSTNPAPTCTPSPDFVAAADGTATFHGTAPGCLLDATQVFFSLTYHFDGQTYGSLPNKGESQTQGPMCRSSYGEDAMRQILILQKW